MKLKIEIEIEASETIRDTIKRGPFVVDNDGSGFKIIAGDVIVPRRKCKVKFHEITKHK
jgi:hypothetical protein